MQRQAGATKDIQFTKNSDTTRLVGNMWFEDVQGNCRRNTSHWGKGRGGALLLFDSYVFHIISQHCDYVLY